MDGQTIASDQFHLAKNGLSFLEVVKLTKTQLEAVDFIKNSRELRILILSQIQQIYKRSEPSDVNEAAARYYEAKGLMDLIPEIQG
jgi:hypothetical protein